MFPFVELFSTINQELQVIEARLELAEALSRIPLMADEAKNKPARRLNQADVSHPVTLTRVVVQRLEVQER